MLPLPLWRHQISPLRLLDSIIDDYTYVDLLIDLETETEGQGLLVDKGSTVNEEIILAWCQWVTVICQTNCKK